MWNSFLTVTLPRGENKRIIIKVIVANEWHAFKYLRRKLVILTLVQYLRTTSINGLQRKMYSLWGYLGQIPVGPRDVQVVNVLIEEHLLCSRFHKAQFCGNNLVQQNTVEIRRRVRYNVHCDDYIGLVARSAASWFIVSRQTFLSECILHLYNSVIRPSIVYCCCL